MDRVLAGRYEVEVPLGSGGSGEVWRGSDLVTRRPVAIKLVGLSLIDDPGPLTETIASFRREVSVISGLRHPNVVGAIDAGRTGNRLFVVTELAPGTSLAARMDERGARRMGLFPVSSVLRIAQEACTGLAVAHAAGIVHRDIKPGNLMVSPSLGVKIIDFGVARLFADNTLRLRVPAQTVGTIAYMSPEQAQDLDVDGRADLYSLGCVLYHLLSGHPPFFSTLPSALLMMQVMDRPVPLGNLRPDLPPEVSNLVSDLIEKERDDRPATAEQVVSRIAAIRETLGDREPEFEVGREKIMASSHLGTVGAAGLGNSMPEPGRSTVLPSERSASLSGPDIGATGQQGPANGQPFRLSTPFQASLRPMVPPQAGPMRSSPQAVVRTGTGNVASVQQRPSTPPRRRVWPGVLATLLTAALVAGAGAYYWVDVHQVLKITKVAIAAADQNVGCDGTVRLIGTIMTNGHRGPIKYEWVLNGTRKGVLTVNDGDDSSLVQVVMTWHFHAQGTGQDIAQLDILSPQQAQANITFPYSCPP